MMRPKPPLTLVAAIGVVLASAAGRGEKVGYACDGSAVASASGGYFWNGTDEDNILRLYKPGAAAKPLRRIDLNSYLKPEVNKTGRPKEADIEAVARIGNRLYWIGSHGRDKQGRGEPSRHRLFATDLSGQGAAATLVTVGTPFRGLLVAAIAGSSRVSRAL